jgi:hypothetical protein
MPGSIGRELNFCQGLLKNYWCMPAVLQGLVCGERLFALKIEHG